MSIINISVISYLSAFIGIFIGSLLSIYTYNKSRRFFGFVLGFTGGIIVSIVCFDLLPEAFLLGGILLGVLGVILGVFTIIIFEQFENKKNENIFLYSLAIALDKFPEGIALGSMLLISFSAGIKLAICILIHCIPEGLILMIPIKKNKASNIKILFYSIIIPVPIILGSLLGCIVTEISKSFVAICLGFSAGIMIYLTTKEVIPESKKTWNGRMSTIGVVLGFIFGLII